MCEETHMPQTKQAAETAEMIIVLADIQGFHTNICSRLSDVRIFDFLEDYYKKVGDFVTDRDGKVVKYMGDGILFVFPPSSPKIIADFLEELKERMDVYFMASKHEACLNIRAHFGKVAFGPLGGIQDIVGRAVNEAALLSREGCVFSEALKARF